MHLDSPPPFSNPKLVLTPLLKVSVAILEELRRSLIVMTESMVTSARSRTGHPNACSNDYKMPWCTTVVWQTPILDTGQSVTCYEVSVTTSSKTRQVVWSLCNLECETYTTVRSSSVFKLRSQLMYPMSAILNHSFLFKQSTSHSLAFRGHLYGLAVYVKVG